MNPLVAMAIIFFIFAISDIISTATNSIVSLLLSASILVIVGFWTGIIPTTIFEDSGLMAVASPLVVMSLVHMGTMLNVRQLKEQWRTVLIALSAIVGIVIFIVIFGSPFIGLDAALVSAPPLSGGVISGLQMGEAAQSIGREDLAILATVIVSVQGLVGYPLASWTLRKESRILLDKYHAAGGNVSMTREDDEKESKQQSKPLAHLIPEKYNSNYVMLAKTALVALLSMGIANLLNYIFGSPILDQNVIGLIMGVVFNHLGFLEDSILIKANAFGFFILTISSVILNSLADATPSILLNLLPTMIVVIVLGTIGILLSTWLVARILKVDRWLAFSIGLSALFGYPGTYVVTTEVAQAESTNEEERQYLLDNMLPPMLVAGFVTVSVGSIVLAGIMAPILVSLFG